MSRFVVGHRTYREGAVDGHQNPTGEWAPAVDLRVDAIAPGPSKEAIQAGRNTSDIAWTIYAPAGTHVGARDRIVWQTREYPVSSQPDDWTHGLGPGSRVGGVVIELLLQEG